MKFLHIIAVLVLVFSFSVNFTSCGGSHSHDHNKVESVDQDGPEYTSAYICPMHCEGSGSSEPGKCPVCGMNYVENKKNTDHDHDGHDHDGHNHDGHNH